MLSIVAGIFQSLHTVVNALNAGYSFQMLEQFGIERQCCNFDYVSAGEGEKFVRVITEKVGTIKALGPLRLPVPAAKCSPALPDSAFSGSDGNEDSPIAPMKVEPRR